MSIRYFLFLIALVTFPLAVVAQIVQHDMQVQLDPDHGHIDVVDNIAPSGTISSLRFALNRGLDIVSSSAPVEEVTSDDPWLRHYVLSIATPGESVQLHYRGKPLLPSTPDDAMPRGVLDTRAVYLDGASAWYPLTGEPVPGFRLQVQADNGWPVLSAGRLLENDNGYRWSSQTPLDDLYLLAGPYRIHRRAHGDIDLSVWLLQDDPELAARYLQLSGEYMDHYRTLFGDYPFAKFAVVENAWQTGFGMPSFTLLGSRVMRLPFIPYTSLPHEIAHNWLGNGIWVDHRKGNWSEGLTAYLADHWMKERRGQGAQHRLKSLQRYTNFAAAGRDAPLLHFVSRHDDTSQAIGYDKSMMLFHMLRNALGDEVFVEALRRLWRTHRFQAIGFEQVLRTLLADHPQLLRRFLPWLHAEDAPRLTLHAVRQDQVDGRRVLTIEVQQTARHPPPLLLPVYLTYDAQQPAQRSLHWIDTRRAMIAIEVPRAVLRVDLDPAFEVPRYLDDAEQPPVLNRLLGARSWLVMPDGADPAMARAWADFAKALQRRYPQLRIADDSAPPPSGEPRLLLGWDNRLLSSVRDSYSRDGQRLAADSLAIDGKVYPAAQHPVVLVETQDDGTVVGFVGAAAPDAVAALARKLRHYGSFGRMVFDAEVTNLLRDTPGTRNSPLSRTLGETPVKLHLPAAPVADD